MTNLSNKMFGVLHVCAGVSVGTAVFLMVHLCAVARAGKHENSGDSG